MPWASGSSLVKLTVAVCRRMYAFQASEPDSRPPPVSFSPPNAPPISAPLGPMLTLAMPQSEPELGEEALGLAQVGGEDRRGEPLRNAVLDRDRLVRLRVREHVEDRRERLPLDDRGLGRHPDERRARVPRVRATPSASARSPPATTSPPSARASASASSSRANESPLMSGPTSVPGSRGSPIGTLAVRGREPVDDLVGDRLVHDQAAQARAALAGGADGGEENAADDEVEVGARRDDRGVVAAELEQRAAEPGGDARCELLAHLRRAGRRDERDARIVGELHGAVGAADHELGEPVRARRRSARPRARAATCTRAR